MGQPKLPALRDMRHSLACARMLRFIGWRTVMSSLQDRFTRAQQDVNRLASRPDNDTMLKLYALYKQATKGDASGVRPSGFDFVAAAKFDAWSGVKGISASDAMQQYVDVVAALLKKA
jgi:diazepam-binding inhibitor (GABA receptor modulating acyl-CoA-binding protein)